MPAAKPEVVDQSLQMTHPFYPIIYVRGYAGSDDEIENTVADPYMGFNVGATKLRQHWEGRIEKLFFESPLIRLMKEHGYSDVYHVGDFMPEGTKIKPRSVIIYRYYEDMSRDLGSKAENTIEHFAKGLSALIDDVRRRICTDCGIPQDRFRVYLVAHSMGGLVVRSFLQHPKHDPMKVRGLVDKVFTYATPHNGIDLQVIGNVPGFFTRNDAETFNRERMQKFLGLTKGTERVDDLNGSFDPDRFFCLVGTNSRDYTVAKGWSTRVVGPVSDGLVRIANAAVHGSWSGRDVQAPRAFVHRSHSGHFGIVNSEDGYQNLTRFLFGDVRIDGVLEVDELRLPAEIQRKQEQGATVRASYHFEIVARVRRGRWDLHRRLVAEASAVFRTYEDLFPKDGSRQRSPHMFSGFLARWGRKDPKSGTIGFSADLGIQVPEYTVDNKLWLDGHYQGGYLYRDKLNIEVTPPEPGGSWILNYGFDSRTPNATEFAVGPLDQTVPITSIDARPGDLFFRIPVVQETTPGFRGALLIRARDWNQPPA